MQSGVQMGVLGSLELKIEMSYLTSRSWSNLHCIGRKFEM